MMIEGMTWGSGPLQQLVPAGKAGTQILKTSATRKFKQAWTVDCFDDIVWFVALLAPAAS